MPCNFYIGQGFIQAVLLMSVIERRLSFWMFCFMENDCKTIVQWSWGSGGTVGFVANQWWSPKGDGSKACS